MNASKEKTIAKIAIVLATILFLALVSILIYQSVLAGQLHSKNKDLAEQLATQQTQIEEITEMLEEYGEALQN